MRPIFLAAALVAAAGCKSPATEPAAPSPTPAAATASTSGSLIAALASAGNVDLLGTDHEAEHRAACPPADADEREHCVWLKPVQGISGVELKRRLKAAGYETEAEGDKVYAYWTPEKIQAFFGVKPGYIKTGGSSGGMVCMMILPKGARPATKGIIEGWAIDDPICEM